MQGTNIDSDVLEMSTEELIWETLRLRKAIREHRDQKGHERCWIDDETLYSALPDPMAGSIALPALSEWKSECEKYCEQYWYTRQHPSLRKF